MQHTTRSLLVAFGSAAALVAAPLALDLQDRTVADEAVTVPSAAVTAPSAAPAPAGPPDDPVAVSGSGMVRADPATMADPATTADPATATGTVPSPLGAGRGGDLPPEFLPAPPYPQCPITEDGAWWTDPADPYTCQRPGSVPFFDPAPPGIPPELLEPIFEDPGTAPSPEDDCRSSGVLQCTVTIMGQEYVVTFADSKPVSVREAHG